MENFKFKKSLIIIFFFFLVLQASLVEAKELSLEEAIELGVKNNHELKSLENEIDDTKREIELLKAQHFGWSLNLISSLNRSREKWEYEEEVKKKDDDGNIELDDEGEPIMITEEKDDEDKSRQVNMSLAGDKAFDWGLELDYNLNLAKAEENDNFEFGEVFTKDNISYELEASQRLFPLFSFRGEKIVPLKGEQEIYRLETELAVAKTRYNWDKEEKIIDWLESYLELLRLEQQLEIANNNQKLAQKMLKRTKNLKEIDEAGSRDLLEAEINLEEAKIEYQEVSDRFKQEKKSLYQGLGIEREVQLELATDNSYLEQKEELVAGLEFELITELLKDIEKYPELKSNRLNQSLVKKEKKWSKLENRSWPLFTLEGSYEYDYYQEDVQIDKENYHNWFIGFNLEYNLFDSGADSLTQSGYQDDLEKLEREEKNLLEELELEFEALIEELDRNYLERRKENLAVKRAQLEKESAQERLDEGIITEEEFKEDYFELKSSEIDLKVAKDQILVTKLRLKQILVDSK